MIKEKLQVTFIFQTPPPIPQIFEKYLRSRVWQKSHVSDIVQNVSQKSLIYHNLSVHNNTMKSSDDKIIYKHYFCKSSMRITHQAVLWRFFWIETSLWWHYSKKKNFRFPRYILWKNCLSLEEKFQFTISGGPWHRMAQNQYVKNIFISKVKSIITK